MTPLTRLLLLSFSDPTLHHRLATHRPSLFPSISGSLGQCLLQLAAHIMNRKGREEAAASAASEFQDGTQQWQRPPCGGDKPKSGVSTTLTPTKQLGKEWDLLYYAQKLSAMASKSAVEDCVSPSDQDTVNTDGADIFETNDISGGMHEMAVNPEDGAMMILPNPP